jgi:nucleotide-binding universal stress UspA family protein
MRSALGLEPVCPRLKIQVRGVSRASRKKPALAAWRAAGGADAEEIAHAWTHGRCCKTVRVRRILVGYDGSEGGRRALDRAITEARQSRGQITVLSVVDIPLNLDVPRNFGTLDDISDNEGAELSPPPEVVEHLTEARERLAAAGFDAELAWAAGEPARKIVETAQRSGADVIVLGEHHHGFLADLFGANVDAEVQREAGCDVILA